MDDEPTFLRAVRAGAVGYILQNASALDIVAAVRIGSPRRSGVALPNFVFSCLDILRAAAINFPIFEPSPNGLTRGEHNSYLFIAQGLYQQRKLPPFASLRADVVKTTFIESAKN